ncbi:MAG: hypothetical protein Edafosvirus2_82 [Edafosvirus sp.]|uniref:Uncharacterized protein n=1 Tax=Edafosvirus sp. TaxID=2487765 RepID=A0A3G4ZWC0_9VIRU|nr:MAG: hypothetical protein Edafosvirus2_82 [Edafosvirus sp.]
MTSDIENKHSIENLSYNELIEYFLSLTKSTTSHIPLENFINNIQTINDTDLLILIQSLDRIDRDGLSGNIVLHNYIAIGWNELYKRNIPLAIAHEAHKTYDNDLATKAYNLGERTLAPYILAKTLEPKLILEMTKKEKSIFDLTFTGNAETIKNLTKYMKYIVESANNNNVDAIKIMIIYLQHNTSNFFASRQFIRKILEIGVPLSCVIISDHECKDIITCSQVLAELIDVYSTIEKKKESKQIKIDFNSHYIILINTIKMILDKHGENSIVLLRSFFDNRYVFPIISFLIGTYCVKDIHIAYKYILQSMQANYQPALEYIVSLQHDDAMRKLFIDDIKKISF